MTRRWRLLTVPACVLATAALCEAGLDILKSPEANPFVGAPQPTRTANPQVMTATEADVILAADINLFRQSATVSTLDTITGANDEVVPVLLGTTIGGKGARALLSWEGSAPAVMKVGDVRDGFTLLAVRRASVDIDHGGCLHTLRLRSANVE